MYVGHAYCHSPANPFYIFSQQIYLMILLYLLAQSPFILRENVMYSLKLLVLVHKIFACYIRGVLKFKCPAPGPKG